jgi:hypothetical protein
MHLATFFVKDTCLLGGVARYGADPWAFGHIEFFFRQSPDLATDGMDFELPLKNFCDDPGLVGQPDAKGQSDSFKTHAPAKLHDFLQATDLSIVKRFNFRRDTKELSFFRVRIEFFTIRLNTGISFATGFLLTAVTTHHASSSSYSKTALSVSPNVHLNCRSNGLKLKLLFYPKQDTTLIG